ncbi:MAG TPA: transporter [Vicinamibacterales bacterium]|nr:transporter [Vicinamibacterales bacterium]
MIRVRMAIVAGLGVSALLIAASDALAQGCILLRQTSPMFGTTGTLDQDVGTWNLTFTGRNSTADIHYNGTERQRQRETEQTYVVNRQNSLTTTVSYQATPRVSVNVGIPFVEASWGIPSPRAGGPGTRANENARGIGDITTLARMSLLSPSTHRSWNISVGGGVKFPTGDNGATDVFPDGNGNNNLERYVDISVNPGDGGWGLISDLQAYKMMGRFVAFGSGTWLLNPRNTGAPSRGNVATTTNPTNVNTVSDQFIFRAGTSVSVTRRVSASLAWRMEGVPRYDLIGRSEGFRRPGVEMYWEPGITVMSGRHAISLNVPIGYYFNRFRNPNTATRGDSTFPEYVAIATYSMRLGRASKTPTVTDQPASRPFPGAREEQQ